MEKVITKLRAGMMPPAGLPRPDEAAIGSLRSWIETEIDRSAIAQPNPGRTEAFHRMNRTEYQNAIRDLLDLNVDSSQFLPAEDSSNGFDNMAGTLRISQSLMARYLAAAKTVSRMALGKVAGVDTKVYKIVPDLQLAAHYGIPNVQGSDFRRVMLAEDNPRRGLLGQGSILTIPRNLIGPRLCCAANGS